VNNAEISTNTPLRIAAVGTLELDFIILGEVGHGALELRDDGAGSEGTGDKNTEFRFACAMRVPFGVGNLYGTSWEVEFHVTRGMAMLREGLIERGGE
jgi:hypothetical protein